MAGTVKEISVGGQRGTGLDARVKIVQFTFDNAYPNPGGLTLTAANLGLSEILFVTAEAALDGSIAVYDHGNSKVKLYLSNTSGSKLQEPTNGSDQSAVTVRLLVFGR